MTANRLFFGCWPDADTAEAIAQAARMLGIKMAHGGRLVEGNRIHLTLAFLGSNVSAHQERAARQVGALIRGPQLELDLNIAQSFSERAKIWYVGSTTWPDALHAFRKELVGRLYKAEVPFDHIKYAPHITVVRGAKIALPPTTVSKIIWRVESFGLYRSRLDQPDQPYETIASWPLHAGDTANRSEQMGLI